MPNKNWTALLVFLLTTSFYIFTLSPSLAWGDGVRLQSEAISGESFILAELPAEEFTPDPFPFSKLGVTAWDHPLYIVLGHTLVQALPSIDSLWMVNLISAVFGAASIVLVFLLCQRYTDSLWASGYAALALAVSHTFWWHSSTPEVYTLFVFLLLLSLYFFDRSEKTSQDSSLIFSAFLLGLAMTDHILAVLAIPAFVVYLWLSRSTQFVPVRNWKNLVPALLAFLAGFSLYIVQFLRLSRGLAIDRVASSAVGTTFLNGLGAFSAIVILESLLTYLLLLFVQFGPHGILLGALGMRKVFSDVDTASKKIVALYAAYTVFGIFYRVTDQFAFFMTSHVFFAVLMSIGAAHLFSRLGQRPRIFLSLGLVLTILLTPPLYRVLPKLMHQNKMGDSFLRIPQIGTGLRDGLAYYLDPNKRADFAAYRFGEQTIQDLAPNAVVIAEWYTDTDEYFILRHFHKVLGVRPDITIHGWPTEDPFSFNAKLVLDVVQEEFPERPVYLASLSERFYSTSTLVDRYCVVPESNIYRLYAKGTKELTCLNQDSVTE